MSCTCRLLAEVTVRHSHRLKIPALPTFRLAPADPRFTKRLRASARILGSACKCNQRRRCCFTTAMVVPNSIAFATGNQNKLKEVTAILAAGHPLPFEVEAVKLDLPELQGEPEEIAKEKCRIAAEKVGGPVMVEDTSLCFNAMQGLPGPYIKWFLEKLGHDGLNRMLAGFDDKSGYAQCIFAYTEGPGVEPHVFVGHTEGRIVAARGPTQFGWDPIFEPDGFDQTFAEMDKSVKNTISHRYRALNQLRAFLLGHATGEWHS